MEPTHILTSTALLPVPHLAPNAEITALAERYRRANGPVIAVMNRLGGQVDDALALMPVAARQALGRATEAALLRAWRLARAGRHAPRLGPQGTRALAAVTGAAGGVGGLATAAVEIPLTVTLFLHTIMREAEAAGFDPSEPGIRAECLRVLAAGSPLPDDDAVETGFLGARLALTGQALQKLIAALAPQVAALLARKAAAQTVPVLGALAGAGLNAAYIDYFRELAAVRFALLRLAVLHGAEPVIAAFAAAATPAPLRKA